MFDSWAVAGPAGCTRIYRMSNTEIRGQLQVVILSDQIKEYRNKIGITFTNNYIVQ